jgi:hypothetical protein
MGLVEERRGLSFTEREKDVSVGDLEVLGFSSHCWMSNKTTFERNIRNNKRS